MNGDLEAIRRLAQRYARAVDARDVDALRALFHPEGTIEGSRGSTTVAEWLESMAAPRTFPISQHFLGDPLVDLDTRTAHADTYAVVYQVAPDRTLTLGIRYLDELARRPDGGWAITHRTVLTLWTSEGAGPAAPPSGAPPGSSPPR